MKKGFTLIELLAVIVILAIVALITTPVVINIIDNSKKSSAEISATHYIGAINDKVILSNADQDDSNNIKNGITSIENIDVQVSGTKPTSGLVKIKKGEVISAELVIDGNNIVYDKETGAKAVESFEPKYVYWGLKQNDPSISYDSHSIPPIVYDSFLETTDENTFVFVRTTMIGGNVSNHEVCAYFNNKVFCADKNYWDTDANTTISKIRNEAESMLGLSPYSCDSMLAEGTQIMNVWCLFRPVESIDPVKAFIFIVSDMSGSGVVSSAIFYNGIGDQVVCGSGNSGVSCDYKAFDG